MIGWTEFESKYGSNGNTFVLVKSNFKKTKFNSNESHWKKLRHGLKLNANQRKESYFRFL